MRSTFFCLMLLFLYAFVFAQSDSSTLSLSIKKYQDFIKNHPVERVYVSLEKPFYNTGDTISFKTYVVIGEKHWLSELSGLLYVDFIKPNNSVIQSIKLQLSKGIAYGDFSVPEDLTPGYYKIRAYTNWMLNDGLSIPFIIVPINVRNNVTIHPRTDQLPNTTSKLASLNFFPEGGSLVAGLYSKITFKAVSEEGLGLKVCGKILDDKNSIVNTFEAAHLGMGFFFFKPDLGKKYHAVIDNKNGDNLTFQLPAALPDGFVMHINKDSLNKVQVIVDATRTYYNENQNKDLNLIITTGGSVYNISGKLTAPEIKFQINTKNFATGIMQLALLNPQNQLVAQRLIFIQNQLQSDIDLDIDDSVLSESSRQITVSCNIKTQYNLNNQLTLSATVNDQEIYAIKEASQKTIVSDLQLTSNLEGFVEQPNYYFSDTNERSNEELDVLLLTSNFKRYTWSKFVKGKFSTISFLPEKNLHVAGILRFKNGKPAINQLITLSDPDGQGTSVEQKTDATGHFIFKNLIYRDTANFNLKTKNTNLNIIAQDDSPHPTLDSNLLIKMLAEYETLTPNLNVQSKITETLFPKTSQRTLHLKEVIIKDFKDDNKYRTNSLAGAGHADQVVHMDQIKAGGRPTDVLNGILRGITFQKGIAYYGGEMLIVVDGGEMGFPGHPYSIDMLSLGDIETVEVLKYASASIYGMAGGHGVLVITTKQGESNNNVSDTGIFHYKSTGFYRSKKSYPVMIGKIYNLALNDKQVNPSLWIPSLKYNNNTNSSFSFYNKAKKTNLMISVEGIDSRGNLIRKAVLYHQNN